jgi:hypothetical protein
MEPQKTFQDKVYDFLSKLVTLLIIRIFLLVATCAIFIMLHHYWPYILGGICVLYVVIKLLEPSNKEQDKN